MLLPREISAVVWLLRKDKPMFRISSRQHYVLIVAGPFGATIWRRGAISLQFRGHFIQLVLGDWWEAHPDA